ncbi:MAG: hypothetical protein ACE5KX_07645, partial [Acidimicrobiia bacterium]
MSGGSEVKAPGRVQRPLVGLLALFAAASAIDRLSQRAAGPVIDAHVYLIGLGAIVAPMALQALRRASAYVSIAAWTATYLLLEALVGTSSLNGFEAYLTATELSFVLLTTVLARRLAHDLDLLDETIGDIGFGESRPFPSIDRKRSVRSRQRWRGAGDTDDHF